MGLWGAALLTPGWAAAAALPQGAEVLHGDVYINKISDSRMSIMSSDANNVIKWQSFDVGAGSSVSFDMNNYLNLVVGGRPSEIAGSVSCPGNLYINNPAGIRLAEGSRVTALNLGLSTARLDEQLIEAFKASGTLSATGKGMGRVRLLGEVKTGSLVVDGGQIVVRDPDRIKHTDTTPLANTEQNTRLTLRSSVRRVDVGASAQPGRDLAADYAQKGEAGLVIHEGAQAVASASELEALRFNPTGSFWLADDIDLGTVSAVPLATFSGTLDGAGSAITYQASLTSSATRGGLFGTLDGATVRDLRIGNAALAVSGAAAGSAFGALAGEIKGGSITNVEVENFTFSAVDPRGDFYAGALAGKLGAGVTNPALCNVSAAFEARSAQALKESAHAVAGTLVGLNEARALSEGYVVGNAVGGLGSLWGRNNGSLMGSVNPEEALGALPGREGLISDRTDFITRKEFYDPFFIEDFTVTYDGLSHDDYAGLASNLAFDLASLVTVEKAYTGEAVHDGVWGHRLKARDSLSRPFYFVREGSDAASLTGVGNITIAGEPRPDPLPGTGEGGVPDAQPGTGDNPGTNPGSNPGTDLGANPGSNSGANPDSNPGSNPGAQHRAQPTSPAGGLLLAGTAPAGSAAAANGPWAYFAEAWEQGGDTGVRVLMAAFLDGARDEGINCEYCRVQRPLETGSAAAAGLGRPSFRPFAPGSFSFSTPYRVAMTATLDAGEILLAQGVSATGEDDDA